MEPVNMSGEKYDLKQLADIIEVSDNDIDFLQELVNGFEKNCGDSLIALKNSIAAKDGEGIESNAHRISGMAANLGLLEITAIAKNIEKNYEEKIAKDGLESLVSMLEQSYEESLIFLKDEWLKGL